MKQRSKIKILFDIFNHGVWVKKPANPIDGIFSLRKITKQIDSKYLKAFQYLFFAALTIMSFNLGFVTVSSIPQKTTSLTIATIISMVLFLLLLIKSDTQAPKGREREYKIIKTLIILMAFASFFYLLINLV